MTEDAESLLAGEYFLAIQGLAMIRSIIARPSSARPRVDDIRKILATYDQFPNTIAFPVTEHDVDSGYTRWAPKYDSPNPAIEIEEPVVHSMLEALSPGIALDAACGTGRHAAWLHAAGHQVVGVDATEAMLEVARAKVPGAEFRRGRLEAMPVDDASIDILTCALALEHVRELAPVATEFGRVMRPGGHAIISDIHPFAKMTGVVAGFPTDDGKPGLPYVTGYVHPIGEYVDAFLAAGFSITACLEPSLTDEALARFPSYAVHPEATRQAFAGLPFVVIWHFERAR